MTNDSDIVYNQNRSDFALCINSIMGLGRFRVPETDCRIKRKSLRTEISDPDPV